MGPSLSPFYADFASKTMVWTTTYFTFMYLTFLDVDFPRTNWRFIPDSSSNGSIWQRHRRSWLTWRSRKCISFIHAWNKESCCFHAIKRTNECWCLQCKSLSIERIIVNTTSWAQHNYSKLSSRAIQAIDHWN